MSYLALYRKWRPTNFLEVVGQPHIVKTLTNQVHLGRIAHAYLFTGTRGTGKTTTAKIFAKAVNCTNPTNGNPCCTCDACIRNANGQNMNVIEIDAASNNGVDNIREIREEVRYTPTEGKFKVYIIDEVHMLSSGAFNALLKTLEEPPEHVIFILATTEPHKLPATILSRCQRYDFRRISLSTISETLSQYMIAEKVEADSEAIDYVAKIADGSMRDALSLLDQTISFYLGERLTLDKVLDVLGAVDIKVYYDVFDFLKQKDIRRLIELMEEIAYRGRDLQNFVTELVKYARNLLIAKSVKEPEKLLELTRENVELVKKQSIDLNEDTILYLMKAFSELEQKVKYASQKRMVIEIELMKLAIPETNSSQSGLLQRIMQLEEQVKNGIPQRVIVKEGSPAPEPVTKTVIKRAVPQDIKELLRNWMRLIDQLDPVAKNILREARPAYTEGESFHIVCNLPFQRDMLNDDRYLKKMEELFTNETGKRFSFKIITLDEYNVLTNNVVYEDMDEDIKVISQRLKTHIEIES